MFSTVANLLRHPNFSEPPSGETISYQYDALKRLTSANSTPNTGSSTPAWNQTFQNDGFGNLTSKTLNGTASLTPVNPAKNRLANAVYDLNGNMTSGAGVTMTYDVSNRMTSAQTLAGGIEYYSYSPDNKQIYRMLPNGNEEFTFYGGSGEKLGVYGTTVRSYVYFAGRLISENKQPVFQDRLGTNRANGARFRPYGEEISTTANEREKFGTYTRDAYTGLDYADQRYFASTYGRFNTADPYKGSAGPGDPSSWNRYSYTGGDPINRLDPSGLLDDASVDGTWGVCGDGDSCDGEASDLDFNSPGPFYYGACAVMAFGKQPNVPCGDVDGSVVPIIPAGSGPLDCAGALIRLGLATATVVDRVQAIAAFGGRADPGHIKALSEALTRLQEALGKVKKSCLKLATAAAAIAAAEAAIEAAGVALAPVMLVAPNDPSSSPGLSSVADLTKLMSSPDISVRMVR